MKNLINNSCSLKLSQTSLTIIKTNENLRKTCISLSNGHVHGQDASMDTVHGQNQILIVNKQFLNYKCKFFLNNLKIFNIL